MSRIVQFFNESDIAFPLSEVRARGLIIKVMKAFGKQDFKVNVIAVGEERLREMKKQYFDQDLYTDIISFTLGEEPVTEGELYCSPERIRKNAEAFSEPLAREFARVLIHGVCHLCGFNDDTEEERGEMTQKEDSFLTQFYDT
ncbi:MAG: rRNA maturation RNase YbeY [Candidatus Marinimicrobia bacterium]|nr:rRNA maturation RNase YbeY [Candidatus Neomarinimicrobiota bacterium]